MLSILKGILLVVEPNRPLCLWSWLSAKYKKRNFLLGFLPHTPVFWIPVYRFSSRWVRTAFYSNWQEKSFFNFFYIQVGSPCEKYQLGDYLANSTNVKKKIKQDKSALPLEKKKN